MRRFVPIILLLLNPAFVLAQAQPAAAGLASADLDAYARKVLADWHAPGVAIAVVKDDKAILIRGYGLREIGKPESVDEHTVFERLPPLRTSRPQWKQSTYFRRTLPTIAANSAAQCDRS